MRKGIISPKRVSIEVVRRTLLTPLPGSAEARYAYTRVFLTRSEVKSSGTSEWNQVDIDGKKVTDTFTIRYTTLPFDIRDRVRDARGTLWQILRIDNVNLANREFRLMCAHVGHEDAEAAR